jgi:hypothetical protein
VQQGQVLGVDGQYGLDREAHEVAAAAGAHVAIHPRGNRLRVPAAGVARVVRGVGIDFARHPLEAHLRDAEVDEPGQRTARHIAAVAGDTAAEGEQVLTGDVRREELDADVGGEAADRGVARAGPLAAELDDLVGVGGGEVRVERAAADPVPRLQYRDADSGVVELQRGGETGEPGPDDGDIDRVFEHGGQRRATGSAWLREQRSAGTSRLRESGSPPDLDAVASGRDGPHAFRDVGDIRERPIDAHLDDRVTRAATCAPLHERIRIDREETVRSASGRVGVQRAAGVERTQGYRVALARQQPCGVHDDHLARLVAMTARAEVVLEAVLARPEEHARIQEPAPVSDRAVQAAREDVDTQRAVVAYHDAAHRRVVEHDLAGARLGLDRRARRPIDPVEVEQRARAQQPVAQDRRPRAGLRDVKQPREMADQCFVVHDRRKPRKDGCG